MNPNKRIEHEIINKLGKLESIPERDPEKALSGKSAFLAEASIIARSVSTESIQRHNKCNQKNTTHLLERRKERAPMLSTFASIILAVSLILGGSGVTVAAAQASEPGDLLYDIKLLSEYAAMDLTSTPESQFNLALDLVDRRANEIVTLLSDGDVVTDQTLIRYRDQIEQAILLATTLPEGEVVQALEKIQDRLNTQQQTLLQTKTDGSEEAVAALTQTRDMIQERLRILENGQTNLLQMMEQLRIQEQINNPENGNSPTNFGEDAQNTPNPEYGDNSPNDNNEQGGNSPWLTETFSPAETTVNGNEQGANNPWLTETPAPYEIDPNGNGSNQTSEPNATQGNLRATITQTAPPNQGSSGGSGSQNGNH
ncbi:MAG: hypothetical protein C0410_06435 [Anaerolinea sp.]|nr:hypothetical protein [Anaerolinea sp.]